MATPIRPPPRPGQPSGAAPPPASEDAMAKARRERDELEELTGQLEDELEELKAKYEQYFLGVERREPARQRDELKKRVLRLKEAFTRNTGLRFRIQSLHARFLSYERLWLRSAREREEGTYRRDLVKARRHAHAPSPPPAQSGADGSSAPPSPPQSGGEGRGEGATPPRPVTPPPPSPPRSAGEGRGEGAGGGPSEAQLRTLYTAYIAAKKSCNEDTSRLTYEAVAKTIAKQVPELMTRFKAKTVEFRVDVRDGKAILKAIPKV